MSDDAPPPITDSVPPESTAKEVKPGWYDDGFGAQRWYDGTQWTGQTKPLVQIAPEPAAVDVYAPGPRPPRAVSSSTTGGVSKRVLVGIGAGALVLGLIIGAAATPAPSTSGLTDQIADLKQQVNRAENGRDSAETERDRAETQAATALTDLEAREEAVKVREDAVTVTEQTIAANTFPGSGTYIVNTDIAPGTYRSNGTGSCYWARLNLTGDDIIDNNITNGQAIVTVQATDGLLEVNGCGEFTKVG